MTKDDAILMEDKAKHEPYFSKFTWYNSYFEIVYMIGENRILYLKTPQWSHISKLEYTELGYLVTVVILSGAFERDKESIFKYSIVEWTKNS